MPTELVRDLPSLSFRADVTPDSWNEEDYSFELVWTTGARVLRGWWERYYEELSLDPKHIRLDRLNAGAPFLNAHNADSLEAVIGVVVTDSAKVAKGEGRASANTSS